MQSANWYFCVTQVDISAFTWTLSCFFRLSSWQKCKTEFGSIAELIEHYTESQDELQSLLSCARVNHCYEWEENTSKPQAVKPHKSPTKTKIKSTLRKAWV